MRALALVSALLLAAPLASAAACLDTVENRILELVNLERRNRGLAPLQVDETLRRINPMRLR